MSLFIAARQITEAFPWDEAPRYLIRDRGTSYGAAVTASHGHSRPADHATLTVAERSC